MKHLFFPLLVILASCYSCTAQLYNNGLSVSKPTELQIRSLRALSIDKEDTNKIKLLISLSCYHWYNGRSEDSVVFYAAQAQLLSEQLHFNPGVSESKFMLCKAYAEFGKIGKAESLLKNASKEQTVRLHLVIGEHYLFLHGQEKKDLDSAFLHFNAALNVAKLLNDYHWKHESLNAMGKLYFSQGQFAKGRACYMEMIDDSQKYGDRSEEANSWSLLGAYMPDTDSTLVEELTAHQNSLRIYQELKDTLKAIEVLYDIAYINLYHANFEVSESRFVQIIQLCKAVKKKKMFKAYLGLAYAYQGTGNLDKALVAALEAEKNAISISDTSFRNMIRFTVGQIYGDNGQAEKSIQYLKGVNLSEFYFNYLVFGKMVDQLLSLDLKKEALEFVTEKTHKYPPLMPIEKEALAAMKGDIYSAMGRNELAEASYLEMISLDDQAQKRKSQEIYSMNFGLSGSEAFYKIARYYESQKKYEAASKYISRALQIKSFSGSHFYTSQLLLKIWWVKFKTDSALKDYVSAIESYEKYTSLHDSIFESKKSSDLQRLQVEYETKKKEADIESKDQQIQTLNQNDLLKQANLEQAHLIRNITIVLLAILLVFGAVFYKQFRQKQKTNNQLQALVNEKEFLLKEIHHRVKNNLQIVISLLNTQSKYLDNDKALAALSQSRHRMEAMSMIHQKLYQSGDGAFIEMPGYIRDLASYINLSFNTGGKINFVLDTDQIDMDIAQAIPTGLILNEAITNCIKHAFGEGTGGVINIRMKSEPDDRIYFEISDNGKGLNPGLSNFNQSMGMRLIKGLVEQLGGQLHMNSREGFSISTRFQLDRLFVTT